MSLSVQRSSHANGHSPAASSSKYISFASSSLVGHALMSQSCSSGFGLIKGSSSPSSNASLVGLSQYFLSLFVLTCWKCSLSSPNLLVTRSVSSLMSAIFSGVAPGSLSAYTSRILVPAVPISFSLVAHSKPSVSVYEWPLKGLLKWSS